MQPTSGVAMLMLGQERVPSIFTAVDEVAQVVLKMTSMIIALSPYGIFALIAVLVGTTGTETFTAAAKFVVAGYAATRRGLAHHRRRSHRV